MRRRPALALLLGVLLGACSGPKTATPTPGASADLSRPLPSPLPEVAARVNGHPITSTSVAVLAHQFLLSKLVTEEQTPLAMRKALERLLDRELLVQEALGRNLKADERSLRQAYDGARVSYKDDQAWREFLAGQGLDEATFLAELRTQATVNALIQREVGKLPPLSDQEVQAYYAAHPLRFGGSQRLSVSQILFKHPPNPAPQGSLEPLGRATAALARIRRGEDFTKVAREVSEDRESAIRGGEVPPFGKGERPAEYEKAALALEAGGVSDPVPTREGIVILKLRQTNITAPAPFEQVQGLARRLAVQERMQRTREGLVASLKAKARIETFL